MVNRVFGNPRFIRLKWINQNSEAIETFFDHVQLTTPRRVGTVYIGIF
jgi:hypothetical protein